MLEAGAWGLLGASSLLVGALIGTGRRAVPTRALGLILGFGAGTLLSAVAFELTEEAYTLGGADAVALGLAAGGPAYFAGDQAIERRGAEKRMSPHRRRREGPPQGDDSASRSSARRGARRHPGVGGDRHQPPGRAAGERRRARGGVPLQPAGGDRVLGRDAQGGDRQAANPADLACWWFLPLAPRPRWALACSKAPSDNTVALIEAFAGGAVLTMLVDVMIPQARTDGGLPVGLATVLGFALAYLLSTLE